MAYIDNVPIKLNIAPVGVEPVLRLSQNENGRTIIFTVTDTTIPAGSSATLSGTKPDGNAWSKSGTVSGNTVTIEEDAQMTAAAGFWTARVDITNGGQTVATSRVKVIVIENTVAPGSVPSDSQIEGLVAQAQAYAEEARSAAYGSPLTASTAAAMTDQTKAYVYTGSEAGYTAGHWYYYNGSAWTDGGVYNSAAIQTDTSLSISGMAADAKATGDEISDLKSDLNSFHLLTDEIPDTVQTYTFTDGSVSKIEHKRSGTLVRTDTFSYATNTITEVRTLASGGSLTIVTNLTTLETTVTAA